jgi:hypothetical protein
MKYQFQVQPKLGELLDESAATAFFSRGQSSHGLTIHRAAT